MSDFMDELNVSVRQLGWHLPLKLEELAYQMTAMAARVV